MKILILTQWFDPEPASKGLVFAKALADRGHEVEVLTGFPNYPEGRLYPGYSIRPYYREEMGGIRVIRVALYPSHDRSVLRRILNYLSFAASAALLGPFLVRRADVAYVYHPPASVALPAIALKMLRGVPFVYDIQDLWPDTLAATGMVRNRLLLWLTGLWCQATYLLASRLVVLSPGVRRKLQERGVPQAKIAVIYNWCDEQSIGEASAAAMVDDSGKAARFNIVFAGTMGTAQALDNVLDAAALLKERAPEVRFTFVGGGTEVARLSRSAEGRQLGNVSFKPRVPMSEVGRVLAGADALLVHLRDDPLFEVTVPSKIQAYLAAGRPILAAIRGDGAMLVEEAGAGVTCPPCQPERLAETIVTLAGLPQGVTAAMGRRGRSFYEEQLAIKIGVGRVDEVLRAVAKPPFPSGGWDHSQG